MSRKDAPSIVVLTGAGISAESGIQTFRASDGLWEDHRIEDVATPEAFLQNPQLVHSFYNHRRQSLLDPSIQPNTAHLALSELEATGTTDVTLITQNIDNLHERAGSKNLIHMHGELLKIRCSRSGEIFFNQDNIDPSDRCSCCGLPGQLRPHVVWFGEVPLYMDEIYRALNNCDLFISIGTSGNVYPAADFFNIAHQAGAHTVELNLEPSVSGSQFAECHYGPATEIVPQFLTGLPLAF